MIILAVETSCDDTCISILKIENLKFKILSNVVSSQVKLHARYGGVFPSLAKREHQRNLPVVLKKAIKEAGFQISNIDIIAVTVGPGLEPCLWTGINFSQDLAKKLKKPIVPVNHIEEHILANFIEEKESKNIFPAICLIVSGGHTQLILMKGIGKYKILGETRDDAAGECFDKTARILGLGYPGGPAIAELARRWKSEIRNPKSEINLPKPMIHQKNYDFSFSGLKTAVLYDFKNRGLKMRKSKHYIQEMAKEIQQAIIDVLMRKTIKAAKDYKAKSIILGGGVAANKELKEQFQLNIAKQNLKINFFVPSPELCTDNALMTAITAYFKWLKRKKWKKIKANANLRVDES